MQDLITSGIRWIARSITDGCFLGNIFGRDMNVERKPNIALINYVLSVEAAVYSHANLLHAIALNVAPVPGIHDRRGYKLSLERAAIHTVVDHVWVGAGRVSRSCRGSLGSCCIFIHKKFTFRIFVTQPCTCLLLPREEVHILQQFNRLYKSNHPPHGRRWPQPLRVGPPLIGCGNIYPCPCW